MGSLSPASCKTGRFAVKLKSVAGLVLYVNDMDKTVAFYEALGFQFKKHKPNRATLYLNWFWIDFLAIDMEDKPEFQKDAHMDNKGSGMAVYISVENVDEFYEGVIAKGLKPASHPNNWPWGNREFVIRDPDGYKLVIFKRK